MDTVQPAWDKYLGAAADLYASAQSRSLQGAAANKLVQSKEELEAALTQAEFELAFVQDWALRQELQSPDPEAKTEAVEDTKANIKSEAETDSVQVATAPPAPLLPFMSDVLMDFDMDSNF